MARIKCPVDCGNAPKKALLRDFNIAFAENDAEGVLGRMSDAIVWRMVGDRVFSGLEEVTSAIREMATEPGAEALRIDHIITHGREGAVDGELTFPDGRRIAFCDVYLFSSHAKNATIKELISYAKELPAEEA